MRPARKFLKRTGRRSLRRLNRKQKDAEVVPDQGLEDRVSQSRKNTIKLTKRNEQARIEIVKLQEEMDGEQKIEAGTLNEQEFVLEMRDLRAGEGRRGSNASQSTTGCCFDPAFLEHGGRRRRCSSGQSFNLSSTR